MAKQNPPVNSTRKEMTKAESEWLRNFNNAVDHRDEKSLKKIAPDTDIATDVMVKLTDADNARRRDIYSNFKSVSIGEHSTDVPDETSEYILDDSANPAYPKRESKVRYTAEDYNKPGVPDEDGLIDLLDAEKESK